MQDVVDQLTIAHFFGGPCESDDIHCCLLPGPDYPAAAASASASAAASSAVAAAGAATSSHRGWCIVHDAAAAISIACCRSLRVEPQRITH
jgi:hypothetical protein